METKTKKVWIVISSILATVLLSGCDFRVTAQLDVGEIREAVANEHSNVLASVTLAVQTPLQYKCNDSIQEMTEMMKDLVLNLSPRGCVEGGFTDYLLADIEIPVVHGYNNWEQANTLLGLMVEETNGWISVYMMNNVRMFEMLNQRIRYKHLQKLEVSRSVIKLILKNNRQFEKIATDGVFLDGNPIDDQQEIEFERGKEFEITLSEVGATHLGSEGSAFAFALKR